ncbi:DUF4232 domain-containing protein [Streptacidiphilus sp. N1-3]|uniref:DUF4232 domain-containing protein n=1 Tax=Streptacidiphilus alkalitolerans TaxID=3342712 RepID=A0ABV6WWR5_9ACTN
MRSTMSSWKTYAGGAVAIAALLTSAACSPDGKNSGAGAAASTSATASASSSVEPVTATSKPSPTAIAACSTADLAFSATSEDDKGQPVRHILLTATNTGRTTCNVYRYPYVKLGSDAQGLVPVIKDSSDPMALSTLAPGQSTYAALLATGGQMDEYDAHTLTVAVQSDKRGSHASKPVDVALPGVDSLAADDGQRVTYWMTAQGLALRFIMSR